MTPIALTPPTETSDAMDSPYRGLTPYSEKDAAYFFGRENEIATICANLAVERLTLFYGPSGVGKSSVLAAGVVPELHKRARQNVSDYGVAEQIPVYFNRWPGDPRRGLVHAVADAARPYVVDSERDSLPSDAPLPAHLQHWSRAAGSELLLVLDQFEEFFQYHVSGPDRDSWNPQSFAAQLVRTVNHSTLRVNLLFSLRQDTLALLDHFQDRIPTLLDNRLNIGHLDKEGGRQAIERPLHQYNRDHGTDYTVEEELVAAVLSQEADDRRSKRPNDEIEAPYLQLVMTRLWQQEQSNRSTRLRMTTFGAQLGGTRTIVRDHLDSTLNALTHEEREVTAGFLEQIVTPSGSKLALTAEDLALYAKNRAEGVTDADVDTVLLKLQEGRLLRGVRSDDITRYEIFHDLLGPAILDWQAGYQETQAEAEARKQEQIARADAERRAGEAEALARSEAERARQARMALIGLSLLLLLLVGVTFIALGARRTAEAAAQRAKTAEAIALTEANRALTENLAGQAQLLLYRDLRPGDQSLILARDAVLKTWLQSGHIAPNAYTALSNAANRAAWIRSIPAADQRHQGSVRSVAFDPDGKQIVSAGVDGTLRIWRAADLKPIRLLFGHQGWVWSVAYSPDGERIVSAGDDNSVRIWDAGSGELLTRLDGHQGDVLSVAYSPDGERIVSAGDDSSVRIWDAGSGELLTRLDGHQGSVWSVAYSPDGERIVSAGDDNSVRIWDAGSGELLTRLDGHQGDVLSVAYSPDGERIVSAGDDSSVRIWDAGSGELLTRLDGHQGLGLVGGLQPGRRAHRLRRR